MGRIAFGVVLLVGLAYLLASGRVLPYWGRPWGGCALVLTAMWLTAFAAHALVRTIATRRLVSGPRRRWFTASIAVPAVGIALVLPITLHMPLILVATGRDGFDEWFDAALMFTGPAHVAAALMIALRARQLVAGKPAWSPARIICLTIAVSCVPFVIMLGLPPIVVGITALPFVPLFRRMDRLVERDHLEMQAIPEMPAARVVSG